MSHHHTATIVRDQATVLDSARGVGQILDRIGDHRVVLIGEATHGTHEFYHARAHLTQARRPRASSEMRIGRRCASWCGSATKC